MRSKISRWGNSLALRIPKPFADEVGLSKQTEVELSLEKGKIVIFPILDPEPSLAELLAEVDEDNLHSEVETGPAVGREVW